MLKRAILLILGVLAVDQTLKVWVKLNFRLEDRLPLFGDKGELLFVENPGMAFGMVIGGEWGKLLLTLFRIVAVIAIGYSLVRMTRHNARTGLVMSVALIFAGALGNIIDSTFYGLLFSESTRAMKAVLFPPEGGYGTLFHGAVVDMFHFPLWTGRMPSWSPLWANEPVEFFRPVFNVADAAISVGVGWFILLQRKHQPVPANATVPVATTGMEDVPPSSERAEASGPANPDRITG